MTKAQNESVNLWELSDSSDNWHDRAHWSCSQTWARGTFDLDPNPDSVPYIINIDIQEALFYLRELKKSFRKKNLDCNENRKMSTWTEPLMAEWVCGGAGGGCGCGCSLVRQKNCRLWLEKPEKGWLFLVTIPNLWRWVAWLLELPRNSESCKWYDGERKLLFLALWWVWLDLSPSQVQAGPVTTKTLPCHIRSLLSF